MEYDVGKQFELLHYKLDMIIDALEKEGIIKVEEPKKK